MPKNPARDSPTIVPFGCASDECGREVGEGDSVEGAGMMKEGSELDEGKGVEVSDVWLSSSLKMVTESMSSLVGPS